MGEQATLRIGHFMPAYRERCHIQAAYSMLRELEWARERGHEFLPFYRASCNIARSRNYALESASALECDYLLMQDADCFVHPDHGAALPTMIATLEEPSAVATALVFMCRDRKRLNCEPVREGERYPGEVGTGYMLIDTRKLRELEPPDPWFRFVGDMGEDIAFCRTLAALGYPVIVDYTIPTVHAGEKNLLVLPKSV